MKVSYGEGLASYTGPESCGHVRKDVVEALTGVRAGRVFSPEILMIREADALMTCGRPHLAVRSGKGRLIPAGPQTPSTHRCTSQGRQSPPFGSRETPRLASRRIRQEVRVVNPQGERRR